MALKGGSSKACAACKYQRRRCRATCPLAPYFPSDQPKIFLNAHKLFGVRNISKVLEGLTDPAQKNIAMKSIIYQAYVRDKYPVYGCLGIIQHLWYQIQMAEEELQSLLLQLNFYRQNQNQSQHELSASAFVNHNTALALFPQNVPQNYVSNIVDCASYSNGYMDDNSQRMMQFPFFDTIDDTQSYIDSKEAYDQSSSESSLKEKTQSIEINAAENELKSAAACFSLTSVNLEKGHCIH